MDVAGDSRLHAIEACKRDGRQPQVTLGEAAPRQASHTVPGTTGIFVTAARSGYAGSATKTPRAFARTPER